MWIATRGAPRRLSALFLLSAGAALAQVIVNGTVVLEDGRKIGEKAQIELVCQGQAQPQGKTEADGSFSVELGRNSFLSGSDASVQSLSGPKGALSGQTQVPGGSLMWLMGCTLRASLKGYRSEMADLSRARGGEPVNLGPIVLHKLDDGREASVSATSLSAPKGARQALEKGRDLIAKQQLAEAAKELNKAVRLHPKYAEAWDELGNVLQSQKMNADARKAYMEAVASDARYPKPYLDMARLSATEANWKDALEQTAALLRLEPQGNPQAYYYSAVAHYNLDQYDQAAESAQQAIKLDTAHTVPLAEQLLGVLYSMKGDYKSAAEQFRNYLQHAPPNANVAAAKARLADAERRAAEAEKK
jgi:Flp pilus assembly protein TadD